jgi:hypothetical protein
MLRFGIIAMFVVVASLPACGQTTESNEQTPPPAAPASENAWPGVVESFARALIKGDAETAAAQLSPRAKLREFDSTQAGNVASLLVRLAKSTLVGQHAYVHQPLAMAADIRADFKNAAAIPEKDKVKFLIEDEIDMKRANSTAAQWTVEQLDARGGVPVGVIVLWTPRPQPAGAPESETVAYDVLFVLCRAEEVAPHEFKITSVVYGNPLPAANP